MSVEPKRLTTEQRFSLSAYAERVDKKSGYLELFVCSLTGVGHVWASDLVAHILALEAEIAAKPGMPSLAMEPEKKLPAPPETIPPQ